MIREQLTLNPESEPASPRSSMQSNYPRMSAVSFYLPDVHTAPNSSNTSIGRDDIIPVTSNSPNSSNTSIGSDDLILAARNSNVARSPTRKLAEEK
ncbi:hypothetical protein N7509_001308 [Penicillium cosmopolitanum]|uniref:Uncharacterized protein n=1 Tax=Penicillium cosmopolitanum TaxID=1131564 RepID=A0A9W9WBZ0_9EURO|nr:uncharacterized protein N7509_001308 [Penicillium cosmopolitanum]KAJ5414681.1 hypothetical protein N7509_001308 [Penicillium cosmopolitanum]